MRVVPPKATSGSQASVERDPDQAGGHACRVEAVVARECVHANEVARLDLTHQLGLLGAHGRARALRVATA
jgi:hypothetical protein